MDLPDHPRPVPAFHVACASLAWVVAAAQLAVLGHVLFTGLIHPLQYVLLLWPEDVSWLVTAGVGAAVGAVGLGVSAALAPSGRRGGRVVDLGRAAWPGTLACAWAGVLWMRHGASPPTVAGLIILMSILPTGWAVGRIVALGGREMDVASPAARWWREPSWWALVAIVCGLAVLHAWVQLRLHAMWIYGSPDIGYYAEMLLNVTRGRGLLCEAFGHHFFGEHFSPGLYLLVPLYALYPHIDTLMVVGAVAPTSGALAVYALARARGAGQGGALALGLGFLLFPSMSRVIYGGSYGFHEILVAIPLMLWSFYFVERRRWWWALACALLALSFKENVAIVYAAYGACVVLRPGPPSRVAGVVLCIASAAYFGAVMGWIVPAYNTAGDYSKLYLFEQLGSGPVEIVTTLVTRPDIVIERLFRWRVFGFGVILLVPVAGIAGLRMALLAAAPTFVFICLMNTLDFASVRFWHQSSILAIVWLATVQAAVVPDARRRRARIAAVFTCCLLSHYALGLSPATRLWRELDLDPAGQPTALVQLQELIPRSDTVQVSPRLAAHFVDYERVYPLHVHPDPLPRWIIVDRADQFAGESAMRDMQQYVAGVVSAGTYVPVVDLSGIIVLRIADGTPVGP